LKGASIGDIFQNLLTASNASSIDGCALNESEEWKIYLIDNGTSDKFFMHLYYYNTTSLPTPVFGSIYSINEPL